MADDGELLQQALGDQYALERERRVVQLESVRLELLRLRAGVGSSDAVHRALEPAPSAALPS